MREFYRVGKTGSLNNLRYSTAAIPPLQPGRVLVETKAIGLNYADIFAIMGLYSATPKGTFVPGLEFSGVVLRSASALFKEGQRVIGLTRFGGYDSHILADPQYLFVLPDSWTFAEGAAFPVQTLTAYYALKVLGDIQQHQTVLIHSAAGGVGLQAHRIAKKYNAYTIGVVGRREKFGVLQQEGFDGKIVRGRSFSDDLKAALAGRYLHLVLETTGGKYFRYSYDALAPMGRLIAYGSAQFTPSSIRPNYLSLGIKYLFRPKIDPLHMITANKSVMGFNLIWLYERHALMKALMEEIEALHLPPPKVGHRYAFSEALEALRIFKGGKTIGKVILTR